MSKSLGEVAFMNDGRTIITAADGSRTEYRPGLPSPCFMWGQEAGEMLGLPVEPMQWTGYLGFSSAIGEDRILRWDTSVEVT